MSRLARVYCWSRWVIVLVASTAVVWGTQCNPVRQRPDARLPVPGWHEEQRGVPLREFVERLERKTRVFSAPGSIDGDD